MVFGNLLLHLYYTNPKAMKITLFLLIAAAMAGTSHAAARPEGAAQLTQQKNITICVGETSTPILLDRTDNELFRIRLDTPDGGTLTSLTMTLDAESARHAAEVKLYYGGTDARNTPRERLAPTDYIPDGRLEAEPSYSQLLAYDKGARTVSFDVGKELFRGINYLWVSIRMKHNTPLTHKLSAAISTITVDGAECTFETVGRTGQPHRMAVGVRHAGDDAPPHTAYRALSPPRAERCSPSTTCATTPRRISSSISTSG